MSISLVADFSEIEHIVKAMGRLEELDRAVLLDSLGFEAENQVRRRIEEEKESPDGTPWPVWSKRYAKTRRSGHSLLQGDGNLLDTVQYLLEPDHVEVGSNLIYAGRQNDGDGDQGSGIPARTYLGFSAENEGDLQAIVDDFLSEQLARLH